MGQPAKQTHAFKPHHSRPFRGRHIVALGLSGLLVAASCLELGSVIGARRMGAGHVAGATTAQSRMGVVRTAAFTLHYDPAVFSADGQSGTSQIVRESELAGNLALDTVTLKPTKGGMPAMLGASRLVLSTRDAAAPEGSNTVTVKQISTSPTMLGGRFATRTDYELTPLVTNLPVYAVQWKLSGGNGAPITATLHGLLSAMVPHEYQAVLDSLGTYSPFGVKAASSDAAPPLLADSVSPSVVRIYHVVCGSLRVNDTAIGGDKLCDGTTGSGFFVSREGYIATNGHVVISGAKDIFANLLTSSPELLVNYLRSNGLSVDQILTISEHPELMASMIAKIYETSDDHIVLEHSQEAIFVALGNEPLKVNTAAAPEDVFNLKETDYVVRAKVAAYNYSPKDMFTIAVDNAVGFSSSDVALLKTEAHNAPALPLYRGRASQDQGIIVVGFPADAENDLVSPNVIAPTVTRGSVSAIRLAAGATGTLYQSDADASRGSSGGPAVNMNGEVIGLLTYRFASNERADAAKSYIRDIQDLIKLAKDNDIALLADSPVQAAWRTGLNLYASQHYEDALQLFASVKGQYAAHRLAGTYIDSATAAIEQGKNIPQHAALTYTISVLVFTAAFATLLTMIMRHYAHHRLWRHVAAGAPHTTHPA